MAGSKPGERRGGRKKGTPNKATADVKAAAQQYTEAAIKRLAHLMMKAESEQAQVAACRELLDRGHGKAAQAIVNAADAPFKVEVTRIERVIVDPPNPDA